MTSGPPPDAKHVSPPMLARDLVFFVTGRRLPAPRNWRPRMDDGVMLRVTWTKTVLLQKLAFERDFRDKTAGEGTPWAK